MVVRRKKTNIWFKNGMLMGALGILGISSYWLVYKHKPQQEAASEQSKLLFSLKNKPIQMIRITAQGKVTEFQCLDMAAKLCKAGDNSKWELSAPIKSRADDSNVNSLVSAISTLAATDIIDLKPDTPEKRAQLLKDYGLDEAVLPTPAVRKVEVKTEYGTTVAYLGLNHPIGDGFYSVVETTAGAAQGKPDTSRVLIAPNFFKANFEKDLTHWRDKKIISLASHEVDSFQIKTQQSAVNGKRKDGKWEVASSTNPQDFLSGDTEAIDALTSAATYLNAKDFAADSKTSPAAKSALTGAKQVLSLTLNKPPKSPSDAKEKAESVTLILYQKGAPAKNTAKDAGNTKFYLTASTAEPLFEVDASARERLEKNFKDLRQSRLITSSDRFGVKRIILSGEPMGPTTKDELIINQKDNAWTLEKEAKPADDGKVSAFLEKLSGNRVRDFKAMAPSADEKKALQIQLETETTGSPKKTLRFAIWKSSGSLVARDLDSKRKEVMILDPTIEKDLPWGRDHFNAAPKPAGSGAPAPIPPIGQPDPHGHGQAHDH